MSICIQHNFSTQIILQQFLLFEIIIRCLRLQLSFRENWFFWLWRVLLAFNRFFAKIASGDSSYFNFFRDERNLQMKKGKKSLTFLIMKRESCRILDELWKHFMIKHLSQGTISFSECHENDPKSCKPISLNSRWEREGILR